MIHMSDQAYVKLANQYFPKSLTLADLEHRSSELTKLNRQYELKKIIRQLDYEAPSVAARIGVGGEPTLEAFYTNLIDNPFHSPGAIADGLFYARLGWLFEKLGMPNFKFGLLFDNGDANSSGQSGVLNALGNLIFDEELRKNPHIRTTFYDRMKINALLHTHHRRPASKTQEERQKLAEMLDGFIELRSKAVQIECSDEVHQLVKPIKHSKN
jgi:hypothetical protein